MTVLKQLVPAIATLGLIFGLALASNVLLDRYLFGSEACVDNRGSWQNWLWPNVPTLSPPCPAAPEARQPTEKQ
jgi:hypothetical protein